MSSDSQQNEESVKLVDLIKQASDQFDTLCQERHKAGQAEYGSFTFLENDVVNMMLEELADTANYCRYQFIKLAILQNLVADELGDDADDIGMGSFKGVGDVGWDGNSSGS